MPDSLEEFLNGEKSGSTLDVSGSLACQECEEIVQRGKLNEENMILTYKCSNGHKSQVKL